MGLKEVKKIAILGGTFDPIHYGHISAAREILKKTDVEKILFIPNGLPPHKNIEEVTSAEIRLEMTSLALEEEEHMVISDIEAKREGFTYTVDTISQIKEMLGEGLEIKFITGADAILYISSWKDYKRLLEICGFIVITRPGYNKDLLISQINAIEEMSCCDIDFIEVEPVDISSSEIRAWVKEGKSIEGFVPEVVRKYIDENRLYR